MNIYTLNERYLRKRMTVTITIHRPVAHRILYWFGMKSLSLGAWLLGVGTVIVKESE